MSRTVCDFYYSFIVVCTIDSVGSKKEKGIIINVLYNWGNSKWLCNQPSKYDQKSPLPRSHYQGTGIGRKKKKYDINFAVKKSIIWQIPARKNIVNMYVALKKVWRPTLPWMFGTFLEVMLYLQSHVMVWNTGSPGNRPWLLIYFL